MPAARRSGTRNFRAPAVVRQSRPRNNCVIVSTSAAWRGRFPVTRHGVRGEQKRAMVRTKSSDFPHIVPHISVIESSAAELRLADARVFVERHAGEAGDLHVVGATRGAVDDLVRSIAVSAGATVGLHRFSLTHLAVRLAAPVLAAAGDAPSTYLGGEAVAARAAFGAQQEG